MRPVTLGLDVGTTSVKALLLDSGGRVAAVAGHEHGIVRRAGVVEADPEQWWASACAAVGRLAAMADGLLGQVAAVGLTGNMSSVVLLGRDREPLGHAPLLADNRGERQLAALPPAVRELIVTRTRNQPATAFSLATLLYLRDEAPGLLGQAHAWVSAKDYLRLRLTGAVGTDRTDAYNSLLISAGGHDWDPELIDATGLPQRIFPQIFPSTSQAGVVTSEAAARTGLPAGVPVVTGAGDIAAGALGAGTTDPGDVLISLGTSVTALAPVDERGGTAWLGHLTYHPAASGGPGLALASLLTGGLALNWLRMVLADGVLAADQGEPLDADDALDADDPLVFLPHLAGTGSPGFLPYVQGSLVGLRPSTTPAAIVRALFEAIGFEIAEALTLLGPAGPPSGQDGGIRDGGILVSGGGTRLPAWVQTIADVLGRPVTVGADPDVSAIGAARLAWAGLTGAPAQDAPRDRVATETRYEPVAERAGPLRARAGRYRQARDFMTAYYKDSRAGNATP
ncbi:MAG TPA: FGGY family carbohydrate kinase [Trebonia sp.]|jgi:xylulokinase|nr:FGGY family carbohydrate kinase [Trebonia sp.]